MVLSARPAAARARTSPASVSVSNAASSSGPAGARASRRSRTTASATRTTWFHVTRKNTEHHDRLSGNMKYAQPQNLPVVTPEHPGPRSARDGSHPGNARVVGYHYRRRHAAASPHRDEPITTRVKRAQ